MGSNLQACSEIATPIPETLGLILPFARNTQNFTKTNKFYAINDNLDRKWNEIILLPPRQSPWRSATRKPTVSGSAILQKYSNIKISPKNLANAETYTSSKTASNCFSIKIL